MRTGAAARSMGIAIAMTVAMGCNALDEAEPESGVRRVVPTDTRGVVQALRTPPPITGGTLALDAEGLIAVAADPARDRVSIVELDTSAVHNVDLEPGDEPGRVLVDPEGLAHVALRRGHAVVTIDTARAEVIARREVCAAPRGMAYEDATGLLHVACADGLLVSLPAAGGSITRSVRVQEDLRDVVVRGDELVVSRFKSAELLVVDAEGSVMTRTEAPAVREFPSTPERADRNPNGVLMQSTVAWRSIATSEGVLMLHEHASTEEIDLTPESNDTVTASASAYGSSDLGFECGGIVQTSISHVGPNGAGTITLPHVVTAVDMALAYDGTVAVAQAGISDTEAPRPFLVSEEPDRLALAPRELPMHSSVLIVTAPSTQDAGGDPVAPLGCAFPNSLPIEEPVTAVAFAPGTRKLIAQTREPAQLVIFRDAPNGAMSRIALGGESVADTGHDLFHRDAGTGIACASCHAEGGEDGHVWRFGGIGARRTQAVHVGLEGTAPFHWDGDMQDIGHLMNEVLVSRMGGVHQSAERENALTSWLFALRPPPAMKDASDPDAVRGKALFESAEAGCTSCHDGEALTNSQSFDVGTTDDGHPLQVPSLRGIAYRAPFIHDGCAGTLQERFGPDCGGGDLHGHTSQMSGEEIDDLVAYLQTL